MLENLYTYAEEPRNVKTDPRLARARRKVKLAISAIIAFFVGCVPVFIAYMLWPNVLSWPIFISFLGCFSVLISVIPYYIILLIRRVRILEIQDIRRQAAARGESDLLAEEQPIPDAYAHALPFRIRQSPSKRFFLSFTTRGSICLVGICVGIVLHLSSLSLSQTFIACWLITLGVIAMSVSIIDFYNGYRRYREQITVTENGVIAHGSHIRYLAWDEISLFAIDHPLGNERKALTEFELSSSNEIIRWRWSQSDKYSLIYRDYTVAATDEYDKQMQTLLALIAGRTGLTLYDLR